ncbi:hypothetical protein NIES806_15270 [Dolichospermum compactum NIES-806]|uniref:Uncharacterized protein n=1 Tax=Dolichospermum compactum NIES-806 TaxID=1973481 RepID=A0A1Z4V1Z8_9CYAN|nr:hypothetical protein NIES806_15270 [Dolichospermum compactum NIES-806]
MRVRSQAEGFWRVLSFDNYTGKGWKISRNDQVTNGGSGLTCVG